MDYDILIYILKNNLTEKYTDLIDYIIENKEIVGEFCNECNKIIYKCSCY